MVCILCILRREVSLLALIVAEFLLRHSTHLFTANSKAIPQLVGILLLITDDLNKATSLEDRVRIYQEMCHLKTPSRCCRRYIGILYL